MHPVMRRVPAERVRHAKRLGHEARANGPIITTTQDDATSATSAIQASSAIQTSSSSLPASSVAQSSSSPSSTTTSSASTSSSASSSATRTSTLAASPSPSATLAQPAVSTYTFTTSSPTSTPTNTTAVGHSSLSGGAIAGIIAGAVIVGVALIVFLVRKTYLRRREHKRISWNAASGLGAGIPDEPKFPDISERLVSDLPSHPGAPLSPFEAHGQSVYSTPVPPSVHMQPPALSYGAPALPSATYNNPSPITAYPTQHVPSAYNRPGPTASFTPGFAASTPPPVRGQYAPLEAVVRCTFVPTLPDELSISTGERVFILEHYDDGWNLCANARGERGMVPRDCLEHAPADQPGTGWRNVARTSSLTPDGTRF